MPRLQRVHRLEVEMLAGTEVWRNHIDIAQSGVGAETVPQFTDAIVGAFIDFLQAMHYPDTTIQQATMREIWYKQGPPPHPEHFPLWTEFIGVLGEGNTTFGGAHNANFLPKDVCVFLKKTTTGGKAGKMFLRNILTEVDVAAGFSGAWAFSDGAGHWQTTVAEAAIASFLGGFFVDPPTTGDYFYAVTHLENIADTDPRTPFATLMSGLVPQRPVWNRANR